MPGKRFNLKFSKGTLEGRRARFVGLLPDSRVTVELENGLKVTADWSYLRRIHQPTTKPKKKGGKAA